MAAHKAAKHTNTHGGKIMLEMSQLWTVLRSLFTEHTYGSSLERYIVSRNPQHPADIERYTIEFQLRNGGGSWL